MAGKLNGWFHVYHAQGNIKTTTIGTVWIEDFTAFEWWREHEAELKVPFSDMRFVRRVKGWKQICT